MYAEWTKHCKTDKEKQELTKDIKGHKRTLDLLLKLLQEREGLQDKVETNPQVYDNPSWSFKQADLNGARRERSYLMKLINLDQQKE